MRSAKAHSAFDPPRNCCSYSHSTRRQAQSHTSTAFKRSYARLGCDGRKPRRRGRALLADDRNAAYFSSSARLSGDALRDLALGSPMSPRTGDIQHAPSPVAATAPEPRDIASPRRSGLAHRSLLLVGAWAPPCRTAPCHAESAATRPMTWEAAPVSSGSCYGRVAPGSGLRSAGGSAPTSSGRSGGVGPRGTPQQKPCVKVRSGYALT